MAESNKSKYYPSYPKKYKGNPNNIICRSSWERKFCHYCDLNEQVLEWGSEEFYIPYVSPVDNRVHKYFPDFIMKVKESAGTIKTYVVEVKPKKQVAGPDKNPKRKTAAWKRDVLTFMKNQAKWEAAEDYCDDRRMNFMILTEDHLNV